MPLSLIPGTDRRRCPVASGRLRMPPVARRNLTRPTRGLKIRREAGHASCGGLMRDQPDQEPRFSA